MEAQPPLPLLPSTMISLELLYCSGIAILTRFCEQADRCLFLKRKRGASERVRERKSEFECVYVCVCVCEREREREREREQCYLDKKNLSRGVPADVERS